jgi:hypothetical protein
VDTVTPDGAINSISLSLTVHPETPHLIEEGGLGAVGLAGGLVGAVGLAGGLIGAVGLAGGLIGAVGLAGGLIGAVGEELIEGNWTLLRPLTTPLPNPGMESITLTPEIEVTLTVKGQVNG